MDTDSERAAILAVIEAETLAFFNRDFDRWSSFWAHDEGIYRLGALTGGHVDIYAGWEAASALVVRLMEKFPTPNPDGALATRRENVNVRLGADMAWVTFDQHGPDTGDPFDSIGLSHQVRFLEKRDGRWLIVFVAHGETSIGSYSFPVVRVDGSATVVWMNDAARAGLRDHPALLVSGGRLRARRRGDTERLDAAIAGIGALTPMDVRHEGRRRRAVPVILESETGAAQICWVAWQDRMLIVAFNDRATEAERLQAAGAIYRLSPAQMRLAALIVDGLDLRQAAERLGITVNTARTQVQRMFDKTGARSQPALVKALLSVEPPSG